MSDGQFAHHSLVLVNQKVICLLEREQIEYVISENKTVQLNNSDLNEINAKLIK